MITALTQLEEYNDEILGGVQLKQASYSQYLPNRNLSELELKKCPHQSWDGSVYQNYGKWVFTLLYWQQHVAGSATLLYLYTSRGEEGAVGGAADYHAIAVVQWHGSQALEHPDMGRVRRSHHITSRKTNADLLVLDLTYETQT